MEDNTVDNPADPVRPTGQEQRLDTPGNGETVSSEAEEASIQEEPVAEPKTLAEQLAEAEKKVQENYELYLRSEAELTNFRRRSDKKLADTQQFILTDFAIAICDVRDCLESALEANSGDDKLRQGVSLTLRKLATAMETRHIIPIRPDIGASFDPTIHMAIGSVAASEQVPPDTVATLIQVGYMLNGRIIRAASVQVATDSKTADTTDAPPSKQATPTKDKKKSKKS